MSGVGSAHALGREVLRRTPHVLEIMLGGLPDEWTQGREAPHAWSPYQVVGHLLHVEESDWIDNAPEAQEGLAARPG